MSVLRPFLRFFRAGSSRAPFFRAAGLMSALLVGSAGAAFGFCGFYVAQADTDLFNQASKVVIARDGERTVLTMVNDYQGEASEFAMVVPIPTFLTEDQIHVGDMATIDHLDAYTAPRLVEYFDPDPCRQVRRERFRMLSKAVPEAAPAAVMESAAADLGVTIEASYTVGEYDILILSAEESDGLETWLRQNRYQVPDGASRILGSYLRQDMRFFVAKVNLEAQAESGFQLLRPLQIAFESPKFMLPIRLGTLNADGPQDLFVFLLSRTGRIETTNYRTVRLPTGDELPPYVQADFSDFYRDMFSRQVEKHRMKTVFLEYAWDMSWCDPCAADPLSSEQLRSLGAFWVEPGAARGDARDAFVTRLHLRYTAETFPEDLRFQETGDRSNFQGRYVLRHPWTGKPSQCRAARNYFAELGERQEKESRTLAHLTGWDVGGIRRKIGLGAGDAPPDEPTSTDDETPWWKKLWSDG